MSEVLKIKKEKIPYRTKVKFPNGIFEFRFRHFEYTDRIHVDLYDNFGELIHASEKAVYGVPLFFARMEDLEGNLNPKYPNKWLIPLSIDGKEYPVNFENIQNKIFIVINDRFKIDEKLDVILYDK